VCSIDPALNMPADGAFRVSVAKDYLSFSAAHFVTIAGHKCESLHGHNYAVTVTAEGAVDPETGFVVDFAVLKRILQPVLRELDHRVLLPTENPKVRIREEDGRVRVDYRGEDRFVFPSSNVARIPVTDTTAELLAELLARAVVAGLPAEGVATVTRIVVDVEESPGQSGTFEVVITQRTS